MMTKSHYYFAIFFNTLCVIAALFHSIIQVRFGNQFFALPSYLSWFLFSVLVNSVAGLVTLKYYQFKQYRTAFWIGIVAMFVSFFQSNVVFNVLYFKELINWNIPAYLMGLAVAIVYAVTLVFSNAKERQWLKAAGFFTIIIGLILILTLVWDLNSQNFGLKADLQKIHKWISWVGIAIPILFIMNFWDELKTGPEKEKRLLKSSLNYLMVFTGIATLILGLVLGKTVISESLATVSLPVISQKTRAIASRFEARMYTDSHGDTLRYRLMKPLDYEPGKKYPLVVCLHHGGAHGSDNIVQVEASEAPMLSNYQNRRNYPAFIFVPQCARGLSWADPGTDLSVFEAISALEKEFTIDVKRRYVTGVSGGGYGSWHFICSRPEMFAAAIPICGSGDPALAKHITNVAVWAFHGEEDKLAPVQGSRDMIAAIKKEGGQPRYTEFAGAGHDISKLVQKTPGLVEWLFAQKRR